MDRRDEELLVKAAMTARLPWFSPDAEPEYIFQTDPPELIEKCCHCTESDCVNCIAERKYEPTGKSKGKPRKAEQTAFIQLITEGLSVKQVCAALGIGRRTFYNYKNKILKGATA